MDSKLTMPANFAFVAADELEEITGGASKELPGLLGAFFSSMNVGITIGWNGTGIADGLLKSLPNNGQGNLAAQLVSWVVKTLSFSLKINLA